MSARPARAVRTAASARRSLRSPPHTRRRHPKYARRRPPPPDRRKTTALTATTDERHRQDRRSERLTTLQAGWALAGVVSRFVCVFGSDVWRARVRRGARARATGVTAAWRRAEGGRAWLCGVSDSRLGTGARLTLPSQRAVKAIAVESAASRPQSAPPCDLADTDR